MKTSHLATAALVCAALVQKQAAADDAPSQTIAIYTVADFNIYAPRTALDMALRVPGFSIENDSDGSRGFGQASGNVLINGQRVSGKSNTARDALSRIPAGSVERIEILDGATLDIPGLSGQVLNVVANNDVISGAWTWRMRFRDELPPFYDGLEASASGAIGSLGWNVGLTSNPGHGSNAGREDVYDGSRNLTAFREEKLTFLSDNVDVTGSLSWTPDNGVIANLNGEYSINQWNEIEYSKTFLADGAPDVFRNFGGSEDEVETELSGDFEFDLGPGRLKLIALNRYEDSPFNTIIRFYDLSNGAFNDGVRYRRNVEEGETIFRSEYGWSWSDGSDWQVSLEGAFNFLESYSDLQYGEALDNTNIDPGSLNELRVEEKRAEGFLTNTRALNSKLSLQTSIGVEQSEISLPNRDEDARSFTRPKGEIALTYTSRDDRTYTLSVKREVGQLNFYDFDSSVNPSQGNSTTGNPDIVPQQSWVGEFKTEAGFGDYGATTLKLYGEAIEDIIDQVPLGDLAEGPGNLDSALRYGYELDATLKLSPFGFEGAEITLESEMARSELDDPLTGEARRISGDLVYSHEIELRHDIPNTNWAWGGGYETWRHAPYYRLDQFAEEVNLPGWLYTYIEHKDIWGLTGTVFFGNLADMDDRFRREVYSPRRTGELALIEDRTRNFGRNLTFRLKGAF